MPDPYNPLEALKKASSIGAPKVGEHYVDTEAPPSLWDLAKRFVGQERPSSVAAQDPYGIGAWEKGTGPMPMMAGTVNEEAGGMMAGLKGLYSRVSQAASALPEMIHPSKAASLIKNTASKEEMDYRGLGDFLSGQQAGGKIPKQAILQHLEEHPAPEINVHRLGDFTPTGPYQLDEAGGVVRPGIGQPTQHGGGNLQLPGGQNYREDLLQFNNPENDIEDFARTFQSSHWDEPNVLAHVRHNERNLPGEQPGRFLEEVQSDWHQRGKEEGYQPATTSQMTPEERNQVAMQTDVAHENFYQAKEALGRYLGTDLPADVQDVRTLARIMGPHDPAIQPMLDQMEHHINEHTRLRRLMEDNDVQRHVGVPDAPFKENWPDLALKQQLLDVAADPNLSWIGHTTGATQNERYNLAQHVSRIEYEPPHNEGSPGVLKAFNHNGNQTVDELIHPDKLPAYLGHEVTQKLLSSTPGMNAYGDSTHILGGQDLQIGGEGMKNFYDKVLPSRLQKLLSPFGGKVELGSIPGESPTFNVHAHRNLENTGYIGNVYRNSEHVASAWPQIPKGPGAAVDAREAGDELARTISQRMGREQVPAWIAHLSPEMKAAILKKGFPLMSLLGLAAAAPGEPQQEQH